MEWYCFLEKLYDILDRMLLWEFGVLGYWKFIVNKININIESFLLGDKSWVSYGMVSNLLFIYCECVKYLIVVDIFVLISGIVVYIKMIGCYYMFLMKFFLGIYYLLFWIKIFFFWFFVCKDELYII